VPRAELPPGAARLVREDGSVIVPPQLAGEVLRILLRDLGARVRADGGELSTGVRDLLWTLHYAAQAEDERGVRSTHIPGGFADETSVTGGANVEISAREWAEQIGCSEQYARRMARSGRVSARRVGRQWLISPGDEKEQAA
jgi:excisionase family DNA binding protein